MAKKLNEISNLPQMSATLTDWFIPITLVKLKTTIINFVATQVPEYIKTKGVVAPLKEEEINMKPEEQRAWSWLQVFTDASTNLLVGDKLLFEEVRYRVMARKPYKIYGYMEYHLIEDFDGNID